MHKKDRYESFPPSKNRSSSRLKLFCLSCSERSGVRERSKMWWLAFCLYALFVWLLVALLIIQGMNNIEEINQYRRVITKLGNINYLKFCSALHIVESRELKKYEKTIHNLPTTRRYKKNKNSSNLYCLPHVEFIVESDKYKSNEKVHFEQALSYKYLVESKTTSERVNLTCSSSIRIFIPNNEMFEMWTATELKAEDKIFYFQWINRVMGTCGYKICVADTKRLGEKRFRLMITREKEKKQHRHCVCPTTHTCFANLSKVNNKWTV